MNRAAGRGIGVLLVCLALVVLITTVTPDPATDVRRRWDDVSLGDWGEMDRASVRATEVRLTRSVVDERTDVLASEVTFVMVDVEARVRRQRMLFTGVSLRTADGHDYSPRTEFLSEGLGLTDPGFTRLATVVFEVPDDRVARARLVIDRDGAAFDVYAAAIRVDLGLTARTPVEPGPLPIIDALVQVTE